MTKFLVGERLSVRDGRDGKVYKTKVSALKPNEVLIHYVGWKPTYDEWLLFDDERILGRCDAHWNLLSQFEDLPLDVSRDEPREEMEQRASMPAPSGCSLASPAGVEKMARLDHL